MSENATTLPRVPDRRYGRPPVVEALCEIYFTGSNWDPTTPGIFYERLRGNYPQKTSLSQFGIEMQVGPGQQAESRQVAQEPRMRFAKADNSRVVQLARELLIVNQLLPYPRYEEWREEVRAILDIYRE